MRIPRGVCVLSNIIEIINNLPVACGCFTGAGNFISSNCRWKDALRESDNSDIFRTKVKIAIAAGNHRFEFLSKNSKGDVVFLDIAINIQSEDFIIAVAQEVSDYKAALDEAMESERNILKQQRQIYNSSPIPASLWNMQLAPIDCNQALVELVGVQSKQVFLDNFLDYVPEKQPCGNTTKEKLAMVANETMRHGFYRCEWLHVSSTCELLPGLAVVVCIPAADSFIFAAYFQDLRPMREAVEREQALALKVQELEVNGRIQLMLDAAPMAVTIYDDGLNLFDCNMESVRMFGYDFEKDIFLKEFKNNLGKFSPKFQPDGADSVEKFEVMLHQAKAKDRISFEWEYKSASGRIIPSEVTIVRIAHMKSFILVAYMRDMSEIIEAMDSAREADAMVNLLMDASPMFIEIWDEEMNLIDCNNQFINFFGIFDKEEFINLHESFSPVYQPCGVPSAEKIVTVVQQAFEHGYSQTEWVHLTAAGEELPVETIYVRLKRGNENIVVAYNHDLRQIKKAMEEIQNKKVAEESNEAKSKFLARMSHEIRTPISAVLGISEIELQNPTLPADVKKTFGKINKSGILLLNLVNDILDLSKIEAGKMELAQEEYEIVGLVNNVSHLHIAYAGSKDIKFDLLVSENLPTHLVGDSTRIVQIMNNVLSNAFKYTESGLVEMSINCEKISEKEVKLIMRVKDTGMGMTPEQLNSLHEDYTRFHEKEQRHVGGTGLGMSIVYNLVNMMKGEIDIDSEKNKGTSVTISFNQRVLHAGVLGKESALKLQQFDDVNEPQDEVFSPELMPYGRVLVVDDVEENLYVANGLLNFYELNIDTCHSGYEAIEKIKEGHEYDVIFMDYMMPELNGTETMNAIREEGYTLPIVVLTANTLIGQAEKLLEEGFDDFISKPIQRKELDVILEKHIRSKQSAEVLEAAKKAKNMRVAMEDDIDSFQNNASLINKLRDNFAKEHKSIVIEIRKKLNTGDTKSAHILAHTLKGLAGLISEHNLARAAEKIEHLLAKGEPTTDWLLNELELEHSLVMDSIVTQEQSIPDRKELDAAAAVDVLDRLELLLKERNVKCMEMLDELNEIPETLVLVKQIEAFDYADAIKTLKVLRMVFGA